MSRVLLLYEPDRAGRMPQRMAAVARGAEATGATVVPRAFPDAATRDVEWAEALAFGIDGRQTGLPRGVKRWLDALGFSGWRTFRGKTGCVLAVDHAVPLGDAAAVRTVARILGARGLQAGTADDFGVDGAAWGEPAGAEALGRAFASAARAGGIAYRWRASPGSGYTQGHAPTAG